MQRFPVTWFKLNTALVCAGAVCWSSAVLAGPAIYSCDDGKGHKLTSDRPIAECLDREQRLLNKDGSHRQTLPPRMTAEETAAYEDRQRAKAVQEAAKKDAVRRDRNLMMRFPHEAAHHKGRVAALDDLRKAIAVSEKRVSELQSDRKELLVEAEFFKGKSLPFKLRSRMEANEATQQAQRDIILNQKAEMVRINALYDMELARLRRLWAGAPAGSVPTEVAPNPTPPVVSLPASSSTTR